MKMEEMDTFVPETRENQYSSLSEEYRQLCMQFVNGYHTLPNDDLIRIQSRMTYVTAKFRWFNSMFDFYGNASRSSSSLRAPHTA